MFIKPMLSRAAKDLAAYDEWAKKTSNCTRPCIKRDRPEYGCYCEGIVREGPKWEDKEVRE